MADDCASVQLVRTKNGDFPTTAVVLDNMITVGFWASVSSGALGMRSAVRPPPMTSTLSLDQALAGLAGGGIVPDDQLDLLAGHPIAVLLDVKAGARDHLLACRRERASHRHHHADLDGALPGGAGHGGD